VNRVPLHRGAARLTYDERRVGTFNVIYRYEGPNHALSGARLAPFAVVDLDARRELRPGAAVFVSAENVFDRVYTVNFAGALESIGLPRTLRAGVALRSF
jgi:outer membrane receptor protein involved in Fe transport